MQGFGARLKAARKATGLTQEEIARTIHIHRTTYTKYETDQAEPPFDTLVKIANTLGVCVSSLLTPR